MDKKGWPLLLMLFALASCTTQQTPVGVPAYAVPTATVTPQPTVPPTVTPLPPTLTPTPLPSVSPTPIPGCPTWEDPAPPEQPTDISEFVSVLGAYLDAGASTEALDQLLRKWGGGPNGSYLSRRQYDGHMAWMVDLTGDGLPEMIAMADITPLNGSRHGDLLIWQCRNGRMELLFSAVAAFSLPGDIPSLNRYQVLLVGDANHDGQPEVIFESVWPTVHEEMVRLYAIEWRNNAFVQRAPDFPEMPNPRYTFSEQGVTAEAGWYGTTGAGISRDYTQHWMWVGSVLTMTQEVYGPPQAGIHYLYDGDDALGRGDVATAVANYQKAISPSRLGTGLLAGNASRAEQVLLAFSHFKLIVAYAVAGDETNMAATYQEMQEDVSESSDAHVYLVMAQAFWDAHQAGKGTRESCAAAIEVAAADDSAIHWLYAGYAKFAGYASTRYEKAEDLCRVP